MTAVTGDFRDLAALIGGLEGLGAHGIAEVSEALGHAALSLVEFGFHTSMDPYGMPWAPVKRGGQPLRLTGRLMNSYTVKAYRRGFMLGTKVPYAKFHQKYPGQSRKPNVKITQRMMLPDPRRPLPRRWRLEFQDAAREVRRRRLGR